MGAEGVDHLRGRLVDHQALDRRQHGPADSYVVHRHRRLTTSEAFESHGTWLGRARFRLKRRSRAGTIVP